MTAPTIEDVPLDLDGIPAPANPEPVDPEAPYGRKPDGTPYTRSAEWRAQAGERLRAGRKAAAETARAPGRRRTTTKAKPGAKASPSAKAAATDVNYRPAAVALLQLPAAGLAIIGKFTKNPAFVLDSAAITVGAPALAEAAHETALQDEAFAAVLEKVLEVGPYGALIAAGLPIALQIMANHGLIAPSPEMGIHTPDQLMAELAAMSSRN